MTNNEGIFDFTRCLVAIGSLPDGDEKVMWRGGLDREGQYHTGGDSLGEWAPTLEELINLWERFMRMDREAGLVGVRYGYVSSPEPGKSDHRQQGYLLLSFNRAGILTGRRN